MSGSTCQARLLGRRDERGAQVLFGPHHARFVQGLLDDIPDVSTHRYDQDKNNGSDYKESFLHV